MENPKCPKCGSEDAKPMKSWIMQNPRSNTKTKVTTYLCRNCGKKFREAERLAEE